MIILLVFITSHLPGLLKIFSVRSYGNSMRGQDFLVDSLDTIIWMVLNQSLSIHGAVKEL